MSFLKFLQGDDFIELKPKEKSEKVQMTKKQETNNCGNSISIKSESNNIIKNSDKSIDKEEQNYLSLVRPKCFEDVETAIAKLEDKKEILIDFEGQNLNFIQRMLDFLSGAVFVYSGTIKKLGKQYRYHIKI